jgi:hypothetical protein
LVRSFSDGDGWQQVMKLGTPVTSLSLSPTLDLLATTHVNQLGVNLWANRPLYLGRQLALTGEWPFFMVWTITEFKPESGQFFRLFFSGYSCSDE